MQDPARKHRIFISSKPWTRWWWFSGEILRRDIDFQLEWLKNIGFGGVEIAWVYPQPDSVPGPEFLSPEWTEIVKYAKSRCDELDLGCDFTFGTLWPFGGSFVTVADASRVFDGLSKQRLTQTWEDPFVDKPSFIINHLDKNALRNYADRVGAALKPAMSGSLSALFCDSWELEPGGLWTHDFGEKFTDRFGYSIEKFIPDLESHPDVRYDYKKLVSEYVLDEFFRPFSDIAHDLGGISRVQCHGAPTDLLAAYASADIPESESLLYEPYFSKFAASSAALTGKPVVSCETFTCIYGWKPRPGPGPHNRDENILDLKLLADSVIANGVNQIIWHGMPFNAENQCNDFYATVHVGPSSAFAGEIKSFNEYMEKVCGFMRRGRTYTDIAVYLPVEDSWMAKKYPDHPHFVDPQYHYEHRYLKLPSSLKGFHPVWISSGLLKDIEFKNGEKIPITEFRLLYIDVEWLDEDNLNLILELAKSGMPVFMPRSPKQPGRNRSTSYESKLRELRYFTNVHTDLTPEITGKPLVEFSDDKNGPTPEFWARVDDDSIFIFFANPETNSVTYPMRHGQAHTDKSYAFQVIINALGRTYPTDLTLKPNQSVLLEVSRDGKIINHDITFTR